MKIYTYKKERNKINMKQNKKESFIQSIATLMFSQVAIKILGLVYTLYLTNREGFGDKGNAIYSAGYHIYAILLTISSVGVPNAISKLVSEKLAVGNHKGANKILKTSLITFSILSFLCCLILFFFSNFIASYCIEIPESELSLIALSPAIFFVSLSSVLKGYFNGRKNMKATANSQIFEQFFKTILTIILVEFVAHYFHSTILMAAAANLATSIATLFSFIYLFSFYKANRTEIGKEILSTVNYSYEKVSFIIKNILFVSIPMTISAIMSSCNKLVDSFTVPRLLKKFLSSENATILYGMFSGKIETLINLPLSLNIAFSTTLVPSIAEALAKKDIKSASDKISFSLIFSMLIALPCSIGMCIFSKQILDLLFPNANDGAFLLSIYAFNIIFSVLIQTTTGALHGMGKIFLPTVILIVGVIFKFILNIILVPIQSLSIVGAALSTILSNIICCLFLLYLLFTNIKINLTFSRFILKPVISTIIMALFSLMTFNWISGILSEKLATIISIIFAGLIYIICIIAFRVFSINEIKSLLSKHK